MIFGAILTVPVLYAVMVGDFIGEGWVPGLLAKRWIQLALIAPVMFFTGWPIHWTGWQEMHSASTEAGSPNERMRSRRIRSGYGCR